MFGKYRIKSKFRFTIFLSIIVLVIGVFLSSTMGFNDAVGVSRSAYKTVTVASGDTLWSIAERYVDDKTDLREFVYEIAELNDIHNGVICAGQSLSIPEL